MIVEDCDLAKQAITDKEFLGLPRKVVSYEYFNLLKRLFTNCWAAVNYNFKIVMTQDIENAAKFTNNTPLPEIPSALGVHLPAGKYRLTEENYHIDVEEMVRERERNVELTLRTICSTRHCLHLACLLCFSTSISTLLSMRIRLLKHDFVDGVYLPLVHLSYYCTVFFLLWFPHSYPRERL